MCLFYNFIRFLGIYALHLQLESAKNGAKCHNSAT